MPGEIEKTQVENIAHLARLKLDDGEMESYRKDLSKILSYIDQLNELNTEGVEPLAHPLPIHTVLREDRAGASYSPEQALKNAPVQDGSFFLTPKVLEQEESE